MSMPTKYYRSEVCVKLNECKLFKALGEMQGKEGSINIF
jgi:hypothetical protein